MGTQGRDGHCWLAVSLNSASRLCSLSCLVGEQQPPHTQLYWKGEDYALSLLILQESRVIQMHILGYDKDSSTLIVYSTGFT